MPFIKFTFFNTEYISTFFKYAAKKFLILILFSAAHSNTAIANLPTLGDPTLSSFSTQQEKKLGLAFYRSLRANLTFVDDLQINDYLRSIGQRLASNSDAAGNDFHFFIINAPTINAFAGPAAYIGIHTGLLLAAANESQLASVVAHEIAHVSQRHLARAFDNSGKSTTLTIAALLAAILIGTQDTQAGQAVLLSGLAGSQQTAINFTRSNEQEADRIGIRILADTDINPQGMVEFFEILMKKSPEGGIEYLRTHPLSSNRVAEAKNRLKKETSQLPKDNQDFQYAKARLEVLLSKTPSHFLNDDIVKKGSIGQYQKAIAAIKTHNAGLAITILKKLVNRNNHPWIQLALATAYTKQKNDDKAINTLSSLAKLYPGYLPVTMAYAKVLIENKEPEKSITLLKKQLQTDRSAIIYKLLANAYFSNHQISAALEATGNQYAREGYLELAIQQYDHALKQEQNSQSTIQRLKTAKSLLQKLSKDYE